MKRASFTWKGKARVWRARGIVPPTRHTPDRPVVRVSDRVYKAFARRAARDGITQKALLAYILRDLPRAPAHRFVRSVL